METYEYIIGDKKVTLFESCPFCREIQLKIITGEIPKPPPIPRHYLRFPCVFIPFNPETEQRRL